MRGLTNKVVVVTGGLGDLGFATAQRLIEEDCKVAILDLDEKVKPSFVIPGYTYYQVDIRNEQQVKEVCQRIKADLGSIDVLINAAAKFIFKGVDATAQDWHEITSVNISGTSLMTKYAVEQMKEKGSGSIINFSSVSGFVGQAKFATYNATKFAIRGLTKCWAQDLAPLGIRVNSLCPGYIYTTAFINSCEKLGLDIQEEDARASALHLLGRQGKVEEVAAAAAFLASEDSSFITGSDLVVDGGYLAK